jgi:hypothetical protein
MLRVLNKLGLNLSFGKKPSGSLDGVRLAKEDGSLLLLETGDFILLEF